MPDHPEHIWFELHILGYSFKEVDEWIDAYVRILGPKDHRKFRHSLQEIAMKYNPFKDPKRFNVALLHLIVDRTFTVKEAKVALMGVKEKFEEAKEEAPEKDFIAEEVKVS